MRRAYERPPHYPTAVSGKWRALVSIKDDVKKKGLQMMSDPRVLKLMQNPQVMKALMTMVQVPGKVNAFTNEQAERFAVTMKLATAAEAKELGKRLTKAEKELEKLAQRLAAIESGR
jgi:hypothetical protein